MPAFSHPMSPEHPRKRKSSGYSDTSESGHKLTWPQKPKALAGLTLQFLSVNDSTV